MSDSLPFSTVSRRLYMLPLIGCPDIRLPGSQFYPVLVQLICSGLTLILAVGCDRAPGESPTEDSMVSAFHNSDSARRLIVKPQSPPSSDQGLADGNPFEIPAWMIPYHEAISGERNPDHGKAIFARACKNCHRLGGDGYQVGADLNLIGPKSDVQIMFDILEPSREIKPQFKTWTVVTKDGFVSNGLLFSETNDSVTLKKENGLTQLFFRRNIDDLVMSDVSLMPANLREQLQPTELANLIGYLRQAIAPPR